MKQNEFLYFFKCDECIGNVSELLICFSHYCLPKHDLSVLLPNRTEHKLMFYCSANGLLFTQTNSHITVPVRLAIVIEFCISSAEGYSPGNRTK